MLHLMKVIQPMQKYAIFPILLCDTHSRLLNWYSVVITRTTFYREFLDTILKKHILHRVKAVKRGSRDFNASAKSGPRVGSRSCLMGYMCTNIYRTEDNMSFNFENVSCFFVIMINFNFLYGEATLFVHYVYPSFAISK